MKNKFFYLHIPKTAGSAMNTFLTSQFEDHESLTHIESRKIFTNTQSIVKAKEHKLLTGHITLPHAQEMLKVLEERTTIATFRIPLEHIISHISYVRELGEPSEKKRLMQHSPEIQKIVKQLVNTDLSSPSELAKLIAWLENEKLFLFHDTQTRYLCGDIGKQINSHHLNTALHNLEHIDFIGTTERLDEFIAMLSYRLKWKLPKERLDVVNKTKQRYGLDGSNLHIRNALEPLIQYDNTVYRFARNKFIDQMHQFTAELEKKSPPRYSTVALDRLWTRLHQLEK